MGTAGWTAEMRQLLDKLPPGIRAEVQQLPARVVKDLLPKLVQSAELDIRPLTHTDIEQIHARTAESSQFGFLSNDLDLSWDQLSGPKWGSYCLFLCSGPWPWAPSTAGALQMCAWPSLWHT
ncbi:hypothetical protein V8C86DRAFT_1363119 [Haematococcus lacustris]